MTLNCSVHAEVQEKGEKKFLHRFFTFGSHAAYTIRFNYLDYLTLCILLINNLPHLHFLKNITFSKNLTTSYYCIQNLFAVLGGESDSDEEFVKVSPKKAAVAKKPASKTATIPKSPVKKTTAPALPTADPSHPIDKPKENHGGKSNKRDSDRKPVKASTSERTSDKKSGTGRGKEVSKDGAGQANWVKSNLIRLNR